MNDLPESWHAVALLALLPFFLSEAESGLYFRSMPKKVIDS